MRDPTSMSSLRRTSSYATADSGSGGMASPRGSFAAPSPTTSSAVKALLRRSSSAFSNASQSDLPTTVFEAHGSTPPSPLMAATTARQRHNSSASSSSSTPNSPVSSTQKRTSWFHNNNGGSGMLNGESVASKVRLAATGGHMNGSSASASAGSPHHHYGSNGSYNMYKGKPHFNNNNNKTRRWMWATIVGAMCLVVGASWHSARRAGRLQSEVDKWRSKSETFRDQLTRATHGHETTQAELRRLRDVHDKINLEHSTNRDERVKLEQSLIVERKQRSEESARLQEKLQKKDKDHSLQYTSLRKTHAASLEALKTALQKQSKREATERFGVGPHYVKFEVEIPPPYGVVGVSQVFYVMMASLDEMPHSVNLFLQQVVRGLWDNTAFYINAPHVVQASPSSAHGEESRNRRPQFNQLSLDHLAFQEYSTSFPHDKYTLGFAGRPGGPDFYINKLDNDEHHAPTVEDFEDITATTAVVKDGDPCFAKVVEGFDVVDKMGKGVVSPNSTMLRRPVFIKTIRLDKNYKPPNNVNVQHLGQRGNRQGPTTTTTTTTTIPQQRQKQ